VVSTSRRAELFAVAESDRRFSGPATGDERRMLIDILAPSAPRWSRNAPV
jgi:hypothetical protein